MAGFDLTPFGTLFGVGGAAGALFLVEKIKERRAKSKPETDEDAATGLAKVVAGTFIERTLMENLTAALRSTCDELRQLNAGLKADRDERHDARVAREAVEEELRRRGLPTTPHFS